MLRALSLCAALALPAAAIAAAPMSPSTYVMKAGAGDKYEIESSKLVMNSSNPALVSFANKMVTDHTQSTADVKAAAMKAGLHPAPPKLTPMQASNIAKLKAVSGAARDKMYIAQQKMSHQMALTLHQDYSANGSSAPLKMAAAKIVPVVQGHISMLQSM